jgi:hypothetical protein
MDLPLQVIPELAMVLTVVGVVGWHVTHASPWWSRPLFQIGGRSPFSDRRHAFSWLSYWPICLYVVHGRCGWPWASWDAAIYWVGVGLVGKLIWTLGKRLAGKEWAWIGVQFFRSLKR